MDTFYNILINISYGPFGYYIPLICIPIILFIILIIKYDKLNKEKKLVFYRNTLFFYSATCFFILLKTSNPSLKENTCYRLTPKNNFIKIEKEKLNNTEKELFFYSNIKKNKLDNYYLSNLENKIKHHRKNIENINSIKDFNLIILDKNHNQKQYISSNFIFRTDINEYSFNNENDFYIINEYQLEKHFLKEFYLKSQSCEYLRLDNIIKEYKNKISKHYY